MENDTGNEVLNNADVTDTADSLDSLNEIPASDSPDNDFSRQFAALTRKDKEHRESVKAWQDEKQLMEVELQQLRGAQVSQEPEKEALPLEYRIKRNPIKVLEEMGLDFETLSKLVLNDGKLNSTMQRNVMADDIKSDYESQINELKARLDTRDEKENESSVNNAVTSFNNEITEFINNNPEEYELIKSTEAMDLVYNTIEQHFQETDTNNDGNGVILSIEDAAKAVEDHLGAEAEKLFTTKKYADRLKTALKPEPTRQAPITLSNDHAATSSSVADPTLSNEESKLAAAQMLRWDD